MEDQAAFSPDGKLIYFVSPYSGNAEIYRLPFHPDRTLLMKDAEILTVLLGNSIWEHSATAPAGVSIWHTQPARG